MTDERLPDAPIELRAWRQFLALAQTLHFGRAAQQLHITQPPLSLGVAQLERRLGVQLFERTRRSVALTPAGAQLIEPVRRLLQQAAALQRRSRDAAAGEVGHLRVGFVSTVGFGPLPLWLRGFRAEHPGIAVELIEATSDVQLEAFEHGAIDVGFTLHAPGAAPDAAPGNARRAAVPLQRLSLGAEPLVYALPDAPPWSAARPPRAREWLAQPLVIFPRAAAPSLHDAVLAYYHRHGVTPVIAQQATQMQTIVNLVSAGLGVALVPQAVTQLQRPGVLYRSLRGALAAGAPQAETSLLWPLAPTAVVARFIAYVQGLLPRPTRQALRYRSR